MSHEFKVHHLVSELVSHLHVHEVTGVDSHVELLLKHRSPYVTTHVSAATARRKICDFSSKGEQFTRKYEELQLRQVRDLNPLVYLLSKIADDERLCTFLHECCPPQPPLTRREADISVLDEIDAGELKHLPVKGVVLSKEELGSLMGRLETVTSTLQERERAKLKSSSIEGSFPELPAWLFERTYLTADFVPPSLTHPPPSTPLPLSLSAMPQQLQQQAVLEDLLFVMIGVDGRYIHAEPREDGLMVRKFAVDKALDVSLRALVDRILPVCGCYSVVSRFVEDKSRFVQGMVNQALCAAMRGLLKEYRVVVAQLEHQFRLNQLSLQKLWYYVQPCLATLEVLARVATAVTQGSCRGGKTMTTLHTITLGYIGEDRAQQLCVQLSRAACQPYFKSLEEWIHRGVVHDPYSEFMIKEHGTIQKNRLHEEYNDAYWERRYTVQQESIPSFLEHVADKILRTGKYLNVVRECGQEVAYPAAQQLQYSVHERHLIEQIEEAHSYASRKLLDLVMVEQDLRGYLLSIKHYFLLDQGDLFVHFMDMAGEELARPMVDILPSRLESLLELALRTSLADSDPYKDNLRACLVPYDLVTQLLYITAIQPEGVGPDAAPPPPIARPESMPTLSGLESFGLEYSVKWPLSLVISYRSLYKYQLLFRHLFYCKHVERQLCASWRSHRTSMGTRLQPNTWYGVGGLAC